MCYYLSSVLAKSNSFFLQPTLSQRHACLAFNGWTNNAFAVIPRVPSRRRRGIGREREWNVWNRWCCWESCRLFHASIVHYVWSACKRFFSFSFSHWFSFSVHSFLSLTLSVSCISNALQLRSTFSITLLSPAALLSCSVIAAFRSSSSYYRSDLVGRYLFASSWWSARSSG